MSDLYSRLMLTVIAAALALLATHELGWLAGGPAEAGASNRFQVLPIFPAKKIFLVDTVDGHVWHTSFADPNRWFPIHGRPGDTAAAPPHADAGGGE